MVAYQVSAITAVIGKLRASTYLRTQTRYDCRLCVCPISSHARVYFLRVRALFYLLSLFLAFFYFFSLICICKHFISVIFTEYKLCNIFINNYLH